MHSNINDIVIRVRKFNNKSLLSCISGLSASLETEPGRMLRLVGERALGGYRRKVNIVVSTHGLAALTKIVLANGNKWSRKIPTYNDLILLENAVTNLPIASPASSADGAALEDLLFQLANQQFPFQSKNALDALSRALVLYEQIPAILEEEGYEVPFELEREFKRIMGMPLRQFVWCGAWIYGNSLEGKPMNTSSMSRVMEELSCLWEGPKEGMPTTEGMENFLSRVSIDLDKYAELIGDIRRKDETLVVFDFQPLLRYPMVRIRKDEYIVPIPKLLIDRVTDGLFHDFANGLSGSGPGNLFREYFGKLFERYVGLQLSQVFDLKLLEREQNYGKRGRATPDWMVNDYDNPIALECRSSRFTLETRINADRDLIRRDVHRIAVETIKGIRFKISDIRQGRTHFQLNSVKEPLVVICTFESIEPIALFGALVHRELLEQEDDDAIQRFHILPIEFLESMCGLEDKVQFYRALAALEVDTSWHDLNGQNGEPEWLSAMPEKLPKNPILSRVSEEFFTSISKVRLAHKSASKSE